ncbi:transformer-2 protein homolog beta [Octopus bimaculoides]|uniref:transformer-2 protein homolog beta n=1 Tax=Octopus bimaculoides TaxID=37653 RepID=UPI00071D598E|nr:transformer-2 protein homolog beta [Octopus bimaculoides]|eukprot:XP_014774693.1 PREDICTED: transformer-2 protein homolog beta-like [Octopus bimaculoides]
MSDKENERSRSASRESKISEKSHQSGSHKSEASRSYSRSPTPKSARSQRSASRSRSRSRSQSRSPSRSRSRSRSRSKHRHRRSYSRSSVKPYYFLHYFSFQDNPEPSRCLGVFGLSLYTQERDLREVFTRYGPVEDVQVVYDRQSGRSRGFAFVYFRATHNAMEAKDRCNGIEVDGRRIRVDYSITERAHTPTPGIYLGKPTSEGRGKRSPSPYYRRSGSRYSRSRSRSFSPRYEERNEMGW